ncbi:MAG TPA: methylenetetrahydrofolate--tRNA-(uracil(54)-C(5))-methyltransferase (FADH(2)-oxidizing) TrmFO [Thermoclostridium sp.]|nr:methylenetetrahydrofolate--tRNA-(uracil(54)-C(5))-methyltransferase (FADH(2)-oxidizing) TrmFO [Thermoclostridium sp.]HPU45991.1 methylenetetrahydrofolate--tRNA-(uracil(54)-C(5))-methyltransferase (FADH(2)-oxidizing) TrmFO [Thermoclostridium sp.]
MNDGTINVIGAGLAGCEAAWQIARQGIRVRLYEMKPNKKTPAHHCDSFAELVCSNSLRSDRLENAAGLLKEEMRLLGSLIIGCADKTRVPAGGALAVDRHGFSKMVTEAIIQHPLIEVINEEVTSLSHDNITIIATGPLTSDALAKAISEMLGLDSLYFFDAAAPIIRAESINYDIVFRASRYGRGDDDYINCPMIREEYLAFYEALVNAETAELKDFEDNRIFEGCMPIESMAKRGLDTMRFGPLKPVGLIDPRTGQEPWAVVQLRQDNAAGSLYNMVGFQTRLKWGEQKRVFRMIPGLENAEFERFGVMHRNTFINSPKLLDAAYRLRARKNIFFAGQITGVEGYVESASSGLVAGINAARQFLGMDDIIFPARTAIGALARYVSNPAGANFQPMNANFGIMEPLETRIRNKKEKYGKMAERALGVIRETARLLNSE